VESHPTRSWVGQLTWLLLQAASVVASILLAFAIDAWWGNRLENDAKNTMLRAIREDMLDNQRWVKEERVYRAAARESNQALLRAMPPVATKTPKRRSTIDCRTYCGFQDPATHRGWSRAYSAEVT